VTPMYFTDFFSVDREALEERGAFNVSLINDLPLFVDPFLLFNSDKDEYKNLHAEMIRYLRFLKEVTLAGPLSDGIIKSLFSFREVRQNWLGWSFSGNAGRGLGAKFAAALHRNFSLVFRDFGEERVTQSSHLEKLCLVDGGVGRDMMSDFTTNLIKQYLGNYTQQIALDLVPVKLRRKVAVSRVCFNYNTRTWGPQTFELPYINDDFVLLTPKDILTKDEAWINRSDLVHRFEDIAEAVSDDVLRAQINEYFMRVLPQKDDGKKPNQEERGEAVSKVLGQFPQLLDVYVRDREENADEASSVAEERVRFVENAFIANVREFVARWLDPGGFYRIPRNTYDDAMRRVLFLKDVIENKGGHKIFYPDGKPIQYEEDVHILYRLTWFAPSSEVTREANDGRGPVDFKVSYGPGDKTLVEFKLAKNTQLERSLSPKKQIEVYEKASDPTHPSIKVILYFSYEELERVRGILRRLELDKSPHIVLIDTRDDNKPSASKA
jgi:hypothetical protein